MLYRLPFALLIMTNAVALCICSGCAAVRGPESLVVAADEYPHVFDAAIEAARTEGLVGGLRDRRSGIIETEPAFAPSLLEPWHAWRDPFERALENTISFQRRRARFEFHPVAQIEPAGATGDGPDLLAVARPEYDLTVYEGELELRVMVHVERSHTPGQRRSTWTRQATTRTIIIEDEPVGRAWIPVARDTAMERRVLAAVEKAMARSQ